MPPYFGVLRFDSQYIIGFHAIFYEYDKPLFDACFQTLRSTISSAWQFRLTSTSDFYAQLQDFLEASRRLNFQAACYLSA